MTTTLALLSETEIRQYMADEETENVEFKQSLIPNKEIAEYAVGIGNMGGGWLLLGVTNRKPRRIAGVPAVEHRTLQKLIGSVIDATTIKVAAFNVPTADGNVVAIRIPGRPRGTVFHTKAGKYLMRAGEDLRGMTIAEIDEIRTTELRREDYSGTIIDRDWHSVIDPIELHRLRRILAEKTKRELAEQGDEELLRSLELVTVDGVTRSAAMLLGSQRALRIHVPHCETRVQQYGSDELTITLNHDFQLPLLALMEQITAIVAAANAVESFTIGVYRADVKKFPDTAVREAVANALLHRDYTITGNASIRIYPNRLEIANPGTWFGGVSQRNILVSESRRRNEVLASAFQKIGLAERSAVGVKRMYAAMLSAGKSHPEFRVNPETIAVILRDGSFDKGFAALARAIIASGRPLTVFDLLVLSHVRRHREINVREASRLCQQSEVVARRILDDLRNVDLLDRKGDGGSRTYTLGAVAYEKLSLKGDRPKDRGIPARRFEALFLEELEERKEEGITSREIANWTQYGDDQRKRALEKLREKGKVKWSGKRGMGSRYWKAEYAPPGLDD